MTGLPPYEWNFITDETLLRSKNPEDQLAYQRLLNRRISDVTSELSNAVYGESSRFNPVLTSPSGASVSTQGPSGGVGHYLRFGNIVWFSINVNYDSANVTGTGDLQIQGLPVPSIDYSNAKSIFCVYNAESGSEWVGVGVIDPSSKQVDRILNGGTTIQIETSNLDLQMTGVYRVI